MRQNTSCDTFLWIPSARYHVFPVSNEKKKPPFVDTAYEMTFGSDGLQTVTSWETTLPMSIGYCSFQVSCGSHMHNPLLTKLGKFSAQCITLQDFLTLSAKIQESESQKRNRATISYSIIDSVQSHRGRFIFASNFNFFFLPQTHLYNSISNNCYLHIESHSFPLYCKYKREVLKGQLQFQ